MQNSINKPTSLSKDTDSMEFKNVMDMLTSKPALDALVQQYRQKEQANIEYRKALLREYYNLSNETIDTLLAINHPERKESCFKAGIDPNIFRTLLDYTRYPECFRLYHYLSQITDICHLRILDYGCLVSDYGYFFGKLGNTITFCDYPEYTNFADFRLGKENINRAKVNAPANIEMITANQDLAIFGEVLEHLEAPYRILKSCVTNHVKYIFTSCYPYGDDAYFQLSGHLGEAQEQSPACIELLQTHYYEINFVKLARLWIAR
jgi:hypothetical protein